MSKAFSVSRPESPARQAMPFTVRATATTAARTGACRADAEHRRAATDCPGLPGIPGLTVPQQGAP